MHGSVPVVRMSGSRGVELPEARASSARIRGLVSKLAKAVTTARRHGIRGCLRLSIETVVVPLLMRPFPLYVRARRSMSDFRRRRTVAARFAALRSRRDELIDGTATLAPRTGSFVGAENTRRLREAPVRERRAVLADIDQDGFLCSTLGPLTGVPTVSRDRFTPRTRFVLSVVDVDGVVGVRKRFGEDVASFVAELEAAHDLRKAGCRVPAILDVDFDRHTITFEYVPGKVLREELARQGALVRDRDVIAEPSFRGLSHAERHARRIDEGRAVLGRVLDEEGVERIFDELTKIHRAGYILRDVKFGNIVLEASSGEPYVIDFDRARTYPGWSRLAIRSLRDRDYAKFNAHFGTEKLTQAGLRRMTRDAEPLGRLYTPMYVEGGLRFGPIWNTEVGDGRWRFILRDHLPPLTGARVLDLGANNGFNAIQMLRAGAREVVGVERDERAIAQGRFVKDLFEWADAALYPLIYVHDDVARLTEVDLGTFDFVTALCSLYYLDGEAIAAVIRHVSRIADTLVLQCNTDRGVHRSDTQTFEKASIEFAVEALQRNGFPATQVVAPRGYPRPLVIGRVGSRVSRPTGEARVVPA
jgi:serine/threonine protein kinase